MRKVLISLAAAASALVIASPASAQYYPYQPQPQGYAYGYDNYGHVRSLQVRIDRLQQRIQRLDSRDRITEREAKRLRRDARELERHFRAAAYNGLNPREHATISARLQRLEYRLQRDARDGQNWGRNGWSDRDRDGRNDRFEDDRGRHRD